MGARAAGSRAWGTVALGLFAPVVFGGPVHVLAIQAPQLFHHAVALLRPPVHGVSPRGVPASRWLAPARGSLRLGLWGLRGAMAASVGFCLLAQRFDYLRAHLFDIELPGWSARWRSFAGLFLPFFAAYGSCEYLGYRSAAQALGGRMRAVYALALFGAAAAYLFLNAACRALGMARVQLAAFLGGRRRRRRPWRRAARAWAAAVELPRPDRGAAGPGLEGGFLALYKGQGEQSTYDFRGTGAAAPSSRSGAAIASARSSRRPSGPSITAFTTTCSSGNTPHGRASPARAWGRPDPLDAAGAVDRDHRGRGGAAGPAGRAAGRADRARHRAGAGGLRGGAPPGTPSARVRPGVRGARGRPVRPRPGATSSGPTSGST